MHKHFMLALTLWLTAGHALTYAEGGFIARVGASGEFLEMEDQRSGQVVKNYLPLHRAGNIRYFTAGVGVEERQAEYPHFSLKVVFTAGGKPYLIGVDVTIHPQMGGAEIVIPREQIEAPWLFIDLPSGTYDILAMYGDQKQMLKGIKVIAGKQKTVQLQWAADTGSMVKVPNE